MTMISIHNDFRMSFEQKYWFCLKKMKAQKAVMVKKWKWPKPSKMDIFGSEKEN